MAITFLLPESAGASAPVRSVPFVSRPRLVQHLDSGRDSPAIVVQAPAGSGKSQLLLEWASQQVGAVVWVALADDDAVEEQCARVRESAAAALARLGQVDADVDTPPCVIIDGLRHLDAAAMQREITALRNALGRWRIVIVTREMTALPEHLGLRPMLSGADLAFTEPDVTEFAEFWSLHHDSVTVAKLCRVTAGWPRGVREALEGVHRVDVSDWHDIGDYTREAVRRLAGDLLREPGVDTLSRAAVPKRLLREHSSALGLQEQDRGLLDRVEQAGLGWWDYRGADPAFAFQPMVRRFLIESANPRALKVARAELSRWHLERGDVRRAFAEAVLAEDWVLAHDCAQRDLVEVTAHLSDDPSLLAGVPKSVLRHEPLLNMLYALSRYISGHTAGALAAFGRLVVDVERKRLVRRSEIDPDHVWVHGLLTLGLRLLGRYELVPSSLRRFESMIETVTDHSSALDDAEDLFFTEAAVTALYLGDTAWAIEFLDRRPLRAPRTKRQHFYGDALYLLALVLNGDMVRARERLASLMAHVLPPGFLDSFYAIPLHIATASLSLEDGDAEAAAASLARTEAHWETTENWPFLLLAHTHVAWFRADALTALDVFRARRVQQRHRAGISSAMESRLAAIHAKLLAATGRLPEAQKIVPARSQTPVLAATRALILTHTRSYESAGEVVEHVLQDPRITPRTQAELHVIGSIAAFRSGDERRARRHVFNLESIASRFALTTPFTMMPAGEREALLVSAPELQAAASRQPTFYETPLEQPRLTKKERMMLYELNLGTSMSEAAAKHSVSLNTVKSQRRSLYRKLDATKASEALDRARELGLL